MSIFSFLASGYWNVFLLFQGHQGSMDNWLKKTPDLFHPEKNVVMRRYKMDYLLVKLVLYFKITKIPSQGAEHNIIVSVHENMLFVQQCSYSTTTKEIFF